jgi:hypothetical protein
LVNLEGRGLLGKTGVDARILGDGIMISVWVLFLRFFRKRIGLVVAADKATKQWLN